MAYHATRAEEQRYYSALNRLFDSLLDRVGDRPLTPDTLSVVLGSYQQEPWFAQAVEKSVQAMLTGRRVSGAATWREAAGKSLRGREIRQTLKKEMLGNVGLTMRRLAEENARLIRSLPESMARLATEKSMRWAMEGMRPEEIERRLRALIPREIKSSLKTIARTETAKASTALTEARCQELQLSWYVWRSARDQRTRASHRLMDGVLVNWNDPPNPERLAGEKSTAGAYHAGCVYNCRCEALPVVSVLSLPERVRVYTGGRIITMSRGEFARLSGLKAA